MNSNAVILVLLAVCAAARADTIPVAPGDDVAALLDAAAPGDTLLFAAGTYDAPLVVPFGKNGLTLKAKGAVILDARPGGLGTETALKVESDEVTIQGFTIQHGLGEPDVPGIDASDDGSLGGVDGLTVRDCVILNCDGFGLVVVGADATVQDCLLAGSKGILLQGDGARVEHTTVRDGDEYGVHVVGNDALVSKVTVSQAGLAGIQVTGERAVVTGCQVRACEIGVQVEGPDFEVLKNTIELCAGGGLVVGTGSVLGRVESNHVADCRGRGILVLDVSSLVLRKNVVERCGHPDDPGIHIVAAGAVVESNTVRDGAGNGFLVVGDDNLLRKNKSLGNLGDGFKVPTGDGNRFESCTAQGNRGEGFQNDDAGAPGNVTNTQLSKCKAKGNRRDIAVITAFSELDVSFTSGGNDPGNPEHQPEIEDG